MPNSLFIREQLNRVSNVVIETEFPEFQLASGQMIDIESPVGAGYETYSYDLMTKVGSAAIIANGAEDLPLVNAYVERRYGRYYTLANAYQYTIDDLEHAQVANTPLTATMAVTAREVMEGKWDSLAYEGDPNYDILGLLNYPGIPEATATNDGNSNGGTNSTKWEHKTPVQIYRDLRKPASDMRIATKGKYFPAVYGLPQRQYDLIAETPYPDNAGSETILSFFLKTQRQSPTGVQDVLPVPRLFEAFNGVDGLIAYTKRRDRQELKLGMDFTQLGVQIENLSYKVPCRMRCGGIVVYRPYAMRRLVGI